MTQRWLSVLACLLFLSLTGFGFARLSVYENTPGVAARPPATPPIALSAFSRQSRLPVLLVFVHPRCPCSRASLDELALLMAQEAGRVSAHVVFALPDSNTRKWLPSDLWKQATAIPGITAITDPGGVLTRRFGAETSGQVLLYAPDGRLLFQGGITEARGHDGDNRGSQAILGLLRGIPSPAASTPVFGCPLFADPIAPARKAPAACRTLPGPI